MYSSVMVTRSPPLILLYDWGLGVPLTVTLNYGHPTTLYNTGNWFLLGNSDLTFVIQCYHYAMFTLPFLASTYEERVVFFLLCLASFTQNNTLPFYPLYGKWQEFIHFSGRIIFYVCEYVWGIFFIHLTVGGQLGQFLIWLFAIEIQYIRNSKITTKTNK